MARKVFYSFHYQKDNWRVQQIRNIGALDGNIPATPNKWEEIKKQGNDAIKKWIDENLKGKSCLIVLVGEETAQRKWVRYEIKKAWNDGKGVLGIYIHNFKDTDEKKSPKGNNPFEHFSLTLGDKKKKLSEIVRCYNPNTDSPYQDVKDNIKSLIEEAIQIRDEYN